VPGEPWRPCAVFFDPGRTGHTRPIAVCRRGPRYVHDEGSRDKYLSRLNSTALGLAVYASPAGLPAEGARLASASWPGSTRRDWLPAGLRRKVSQIQSLHPIPLSQASPGARTAYFFCLRLGGDGDIILSMPRNPRASLGGYCYHVLNRGNGRRTIF